MTADDVITAMERGGILESLQGIRARSWWVHYGPDRISVSRRSALAAVARLRKASRLSAAEGWTRSIYRVSAQESAHAAP